ncbi:MAG: permease [Roseibacillus sp.]|nr:permease [Roseibacillus sp.]
MFLSILVEGAPFILLGTIISGFIDVYLPSGAMDRLLPKNRWRAVLVSGLLGIIFPVCECAVVPVIRRLVKKGLPPSCAMTYMLAAPIVNPVTALSTASAFKEMPYAMAGSRILFGYVIAVCVGLILLRFPVRAIMKSKIADEVDELEAQRKAEPAHDHDHCDHEQGHCDHAHEHGPTPTHSHPEQGPKLMMALRASMRDFVDVAIYFVIGITIVAIVNTPPPVEQDVVPLRDIIDGTAGSTWGAPAALMGLAFLLSLCSTSDAFIAATLDAFGYGSRLAFLVFGPMMDVKLLFLYSTILTRKFILYLAIGLFISIGAISVFMEPFFTPDPPVPRMSGK